MRHYFPTVQLIVDHYEIYLHNRGQWKDSIMTFFYNTRICWYDSGIYICLKDSVKDSDVFNIIPHSICLCSKNCP